MGRNSENRKRAGKEVYSIIVDGETEVWYFQLMKQFEALQNVQIRPDLPSKKKLSDLYQLVISHIADYTKVIWLIDFDTIIKENREIPKGDKTKFQELKEYIEKLKEYENVLVLINTPCLEFWYLIHLEDIGKYFSSCDNVLKEFKNTILKDYQKSEKYYKKKNNDIYTKLKSYQDIAIIRSRKLGIFSFESPYSAKAEIFKIFDSINIKK
jgi:hypothetical protein